jgi:hypothetical protein
MLGIMNWCASLLVAVYVMPAVAWSAGHAKPFKGHLVIDPEVEVFTPCGSKTELWLDYDSKTRAPLAAQHWKLRKKPYDSSFAIVKGIVGPKLDCGFCESYEGSFKVIEVQEHRASTPQDCK